jgi:CheY-like chemotaxis protein
VDDESTLADFSAIMLRRLGYRVSLAGNGAEALQCLAQMDRNGLPVDLVITDQTMPMMTGTELARHIREIYPEMPIILCTGYSESVSPETATEFGLNAFLYKPLSSRELPITLRRVLDGDIKTAC